MGNQQTTWKVELLYCTKRIDYSGLELGYLLCHYIVRGGHSYTRQILRVIESPVISSFRFPPSSMARISRPIHRIGVSVSMCHWSP